MKQSLEKLSLNPNQMNIVMTEKVTGRGHSNNIHGIISVKDDFDYEKANLCIYEIVKRNDSLRITIEEDDLLRTFQSVSEFEEFNVELIEEHNELKIKEEEKNFFSEEIRYNSTNLYRFQIIKTSEKSAKILVSMHHVIADAWSFSKLAEQFISLYEGVDEIKTPSYIEYTKEEQNYFLSEKFIKDEEFWREYLKDYSEVVSYKESDGTDNNYEARRYSFTLDENLNQEICDFCKENKISQYVLFMTALYVYTYRILGKSDIIFGTPTLNRSNFKEKQILGMFVSTLPFRIKIDEGMKILELARKISSTSFEVFRHQKYPYLKTLDYIHKNSDIKNNLYKIVFSYQNARIDKKGMEEKYSTDWLFSGELSDEIQIHVVDMDKTGILTINYDYLVSKFDKKEIEYINLRIITIIKEFIKNKDVSIEEIEIISDEEKNIIYNILNKTENKYDSNRTVVDMFLEQVCMRADKTALVYGDKKYTYKELDEMSNRMANCFSKNGIKPKDKVGLMLKRDERVVVSMLACLKMGVAYIPIDARYPKDRIEYILENSECSKVISNVDEKVNYDTLNLEEVKYEIFSSNKFEYTPIGDDICYLIYTSGSTGLPKGVIIKNKNLTNFLIGINQKLNLTYEDNFVSITTISFDIFGLELYGSLTNGSTLVLADDEECVNGIKLKELCNSQHVNVIQSTPTKMRLIIDSIKGLSSIEKIILGGECLDKNLFFKIKSCFKTSIYNVYGPTETTIWSTFKDLTKSYKISAGVPISNTKLWVVDKHFRILPLMVRGELGISGDSVSDGYYKNVEKTEKSFISTKFTGEKVYMTGDVAIINLDCDLEILNRIDNQIKINGQRIELEEIESLILNNPDVLDVAVSCREGKHLICFYTLKSYIEKIDLTELKKVLSDKLPSYMIPSTFIKLDKLPYTLNNKKDRKKINAIKVEQNEFEALEEKNIILPKTKLEKEVYEAFIKVLEKSDFGINTPIFEIGVDSLDAIKVQVELMRKNININYSDMLKCGTIENIAKFLDGDKKVKSISYNRNDLFELNRKYSSQLDIVSSNVIKKEKYKNVLITGATGFLGIHVLEQFILNTNSIIYVIIREKNGFLAKDRLIQKLNYYFDGKYVEQIDKRVIVLDEDLLDSNLNGYLMQNTSDVDLCVHTAACVKHYGDISYFDKVNVNFTENIAKYCYENNVKMIHASTLSISGNGFDVGINNESVVQEDFTEESLYIGQNLDNIYARTKFKAECVVLDYMKKGLNAKILRYGNLVNRRYDLKFQENLSENAFLERIKAIFEVGKIPDNLKDIYLEFTPIDEAALATFKIAENTSDENVFHIYNSNHIYLPEFVNIMNSKFNSKIEFVSKEEFSNKIREMLKENKGIIFNSILQDFDDEFSLNYKSNILVKCDNTTGYLEKVGFKFRDIDEEYLIKYIEYFLSIGYIKLEVKK